MPIPIFDQFGNLSVGNLFDGNGAHYSLTAVNLHELHERFVRNLDARRSRIWDGWMRHRHRLDGLPVPYVTLVNGSFVTRKPDPGDVDVCILYDARIANRLPPGAQSELRTILDRVATKRDHLVDLYSLAVYPFEDARFLTTIKHFSYWTRVFGIDRLGRQKAILAVAGGGTL